MGKDVKREKKKREKTRRRPHHEAKTDLRLVPSESSDANTVVKVADPPPFPPRTMMERTMREMFGGFSKSRNNKREQAQNLAYDAMEANSPEKAGELALQAIRLDPDCVDALMVLAELCSQSKEEFLDNLHDAVEAGERALGRTYFKKNRGHFWGLIETRPYMRARAALAETLASLGQQDEAVRQYEDMLDLNPGDNQGLRYYLLGLYLERKDMAGVRRVFAQFEDEGSAVFAWAELLEQLLANDLDGAKRAFAAAMKANRHFAAYLTGRKKPPNESPGYYSPGQESEAVVCLDCLGAAWATHRDALHWLAREAGAG